MTPQSVGLMKWPHVDGYCSLQLCILVVTHITTVIDSFECFMHAVGRTAYGKHGCWCIHGSATNGVPILCQLTFVFWTHGCCLLNNIWLNNENLWLEWLWTCMLYVVKAKTFQYLVVVVASWILSCKVSIWHLPVISIM